VEEVQVWGKGLAALASCFLLMNDQLIRPFFIRQPLLVDFPSEGRRHQPDVATRPSAQSGRQRVVPPCAPMNETNSNHGRELNSNVNSVYNYLMSG
jgi:hypothetical protein